MQLLQKHFPNLTEEQLAQYEQFAKVFAEKNAVVNLISRKDIEHFEERHLLHSLAIAKFFNFKKGSDIMDLGSGGGLPGIPLAIYFPEVQFYLVDSIGKKMKAATDMIEELELENVEVINARAEEIDIQFDMVVCRAVATIDKLLGWTRTCFKRHRIHSFNNGIIGLKGDTVREETLPKHHSLKVYPINKYYDGEFFDTKRVFHLSKKV